MAKARKRAQRTVSKVIAFNDFFDTDNGKKILYDLCKHSQFFSTVKDESLHFVEGQRDIIRYILAQTNTDPVKLMKLYEDRLKEEMDDLQEE